jgi:hypothetical protein
MSLTRERYPRVTQDDHRSWYARHRGRDLRPAVRATSRSPHDVSVTAPCGNGGDVQRGHTGQSRRSHVNGTECQPTEWDPSMARVPTRDVRPYGPPGYVLSVTTPSKAVAGRYKAVGWATVALPGGSMVTMSFTLTVASVNGAEYPAQGTFETMADAQRYVRSSFRGLSSYWRVWICDSADHGRRVVTGTRAGRGGTGERWIFEPAKS